MILIINGEEKNRSNWKFGVITQLHQGKVKSSSSSQSCRYISGNQATVSTRASLCCTKQRRRTTRTNQSQRECKRIPFQTNCRKDSKIGGKGHSWERWWIKRHLRITTKITIKIKITTFQMREVKNREYSWARTFVTQVMCDPGHLKVFLTLL